MSTKFFTWGGGGLAAVAGLVYNDGAPIEFWIDKGPIIAIQAWHGISTARRNTITTRLLAVGWVEGEQSKP